MEQFLEEGNVKGGQISTGNNLGGIFLLFLFISQISRVL